MKRSVPPLLNRSFLYPGESLSSLLVRLRKSNYYETKEAIKAIYNPYLPQRDNLFLPNHWTTFEVLSGMTKLNTEELYNATGHKFADLLAHYYRKISYFGDKPKLDPRLLGDYFWTDTHGQYCPLCLAEVAYHRLVWTPIITTVCLKHECLLVHECPHCKAKMSVEEIVNAQCSTCNFALVDTPTISVAKDKIGLLSQQILQFWLNPTETSLPDCQLPEAPPAVLFQVVEVFRKNKQKDMKHLYTPPFEASYPQQVAKSLLQQSQAYISYATAMTVLVNWPNGFYNLLDTMLRNSTKNIPRDLGQLYTIWLDRKWRVETFQFIQDAFDDYLIDHYSISGVKLGLRRFKTSPRLIQKRFYVSEAEVRQILHISSETLQTLLEQSKLFHYQDVEETFFPKLFNFIRLAEVEHLRRELSASYSLNKTAAILGLDKRVVLDLVKLDLLEAILDPIVNKSQRWRISRVSVNKLKVTVQKKCISQLSTYPMTLGKVVEDFSPHPYTIAKVIQAVLKRKLVAIWRGTLGKLELDSASVALLKRWELGEKEKISCQQLADQLGVVPDIITAWVKRGLISDWEMVGDTMYFEPTVTEKFWERFVFIKEAVDILGVHQQNMRKWISNNRLHPVSGPSVDELSHYLFDRQEVESLSSENRLALPQLADELRVSRSQITKWIEQGKIKPISGPGIDNYKSYVFTRTHGYFQNPSKAPESQSATS